MAFLKTLLGTFALCAALLIWAAHAIGPERSGSEPAPGLTAAAVLASDGMTPEGARENGGLDRAALDKLARAASDEPRVPIAAEKPAG